MKTFAKLSLVAVFALASLNTYAIEGDFLVNLKKGTRNEICFAINGQQSVTISIYDTENNLLFTEKAAGKDGILKNYDLQEFPEGTYFLVVENKLKSVKHEIEINKDQLVMNRKAIAEVYKSNTKRIVAVLNK